VGAPRCMIAHLLRHHTCDFSLDGKLLSCSTRRVVAHRVQKVGAPELVQKHRGEPGHTAFSAPVLRFTSTHADHRTDEPHSPMPTTHPTHQRTRRWQDHATTPEPTEPAAEEEAARCEPDPVLPSPWPFVCPLSARAIRLHTNAQNLHFCTMRANFLHSFNPRAHVEPHDF
jgi:hypothetical protein